MVYAGPDDQIEISRQLSGASAVEKTSKTELIPLGSLDATKIADTLKAMYGDVKSGAPYIEADNDRNAIMVRGSASQILDIQSTVRSLGASGAGLGGNVRVINLEKGSASTLAEALERMIPQMRANPVQMINPLGGDSKPKAPAPAPAAPISPPAQTAPAKPAQPPAAQGQPNLQQISFQQTAEQVQPAPGMGQKPLETGKAAPRQMPGNPQAPLKISVFGNRLMLSCEDPETLALAQELVKVITQAPSGEGDYEVIRLQNASATQVAEILEKAYNGTGQQGGAGGAPGGGFGGGLGGLLGGFRGIANLAGVSPSNPSANRIRVVADPASNTLLLRASPLDMMSIKKLLEKALDLSESESNAVPQTWVVGPLVNTKALEVSTTLKEVYSSLVNSRGGAGRTGGGMPGGFPFGGGGAQAQASAPVAFSIGVDERSNSLLVYCSKSLYEDITKLVEYMEEQAVPSPNKTVQIVNVQGIDPSLVQQAIEAIQGRTMSGGRTTGTGAGRTGGSGFPGGGLPSGGGFPGGGGGFPGGGGGFPGMGGGRGGFGGGGGGFPGMGGGGRGGFGGGGGGGFPGGGGGGGRRGGGGAPAPSDEPNGDGDFFGSQVKDDRKAGKKLYDPQVEIPASIEQVSYQTENAQGQANNQANGQPVVPVKPGQALPIVPPGINPPGATGAVVGPKEAVTVESLPQLGVLVLSANSKADADAVIKIIEYIQKVGVAGDLQIQVLPLEQGDATSVAATLTDLYRAVNITPTGNTRNLQANQQQGQPGQQPQQGGGIGGAFGGLFAGFGAQQQQQQNRGQQGGNLQNASVIMIPVPRLNAIILAAPRARMEEVIKDVKKLDVPTSPKAGAKPFPLKKASATKVASLITNFWSQRYPGEQNIENQVRVTQDESSNTVFVQAAPADMAEIAELISQLDTSVSAAKNDLKIVPLKYAIAEELGQLIQRAISQGVLPATAAGAVPAAPQGGFGGFGGFGGVFGQQQRQNQGTQTGVAQATKTSSLRFMVPSKDGRPVESGFLEDIYITPDPRINALIVSAPERSLDLVLSLIRELDLPPVARSEINIFTLKKADALNTATIIQQLFMGGGSGATGRTGANAGGLGGGLGGFGGNQGGFGGQNTGGTTNQNRPLQFNTGTPTEGQTLVDLRMTVDERSNSIVVGGSRSDLDVIEAIITRLEDSDIQQRTNEVYVLRNSLAADVAEALNSFLTSTLQVYQNSQQLSSFQNLTRQVVVVAEPISNKLLISATPQWYNEIMKLIMEMDAEQPQVAIQCLIGEVFLNGSEEFGMEIGLQSPVLFKRSVYPAAGINGTSNISVINTTGGSGLSAVSVSSANPIGYPGYNFTGLNAMGQNVAVQPGVVGWQGLNSLGTARANANGIGGFVFSGASDSVNVLIRALKTQDRLDVLSRPQVTTLDNQQARVFVGQDYPLILGSNVTATGVVSNNISYRPVGIELIVTPKITPDNRVIMRVAPQISKPNPLTNVNLGAAGGAGNNNTSTTAVAIDQQSVETTVVAMDGETIVLGGIITRRDQKEENKIPWFGDLPVVGSAFRFRSQQKQKQELLVVMTPHIVRNKWDAARILVEEGRRMDWVLGEVAKIHGSHGPNPLFPNPVDCQNPDGSMPNSPLPPAGGEVPALPIPKPLTPAVPGAALPEVTQPGVPGSSVPPPVPGIAPNPAQEIPPVSGQDESQVSAQPPAGKPVVGANGPKTFVLPSIAKNSPSPLAGIAGQNKSIQPVSGQQGNKPAVVFPANYPAKPQQGR
jgi:type II secretory pathway component GspD/PulD (secretin)